MDAITAPSRDLVSGDQAILTSTFYALIDDQARRRGKPEPSAWNLFNETALAQGEELITFAQQVANSVLDAGLAALTDHAEGRSRFVVVSSPTGSAKSSYSWALVAALLMAYPELSVVFACETIQQCEATYWGIKEEMAAARDPSLVISPKKESSFYETTERDLVIWTGAHDSRYETWEDATKDYPTFTPTTHPLTGDVVSHRFHRRDLDGARVIVVTHPKVIGGRDLSYRGRPRTLTLLDEQTKQVGVYDVGLGDIDNARDWALSAYPNSNVVVEAFSKLKADMEEVWNSPSVANSRANNLAFETVFETRWFQGEEAESVLRSFSEDTPQHKVIGFARSLARGLAFINRDRVGQERGGRFVGYRLIFTPTPGTILLDATADIDGIEKIVPDSRRSIPVPSVDYSNLEVIHIDTPIGLFKGKRRSTQELCKSARTAEPYAAWIKRTIIDNTKPGDIVLAIVHHKLLEHRYLPQDDSLKLDIEGRKVAFSHWGFGIGSNKWKSAGVVFLFGEHYLPRVPTIANVMSLSGVSPAAYLPKVDNPNHRDKSYRAVSLGHLARWEKQLACRGNVRNTSLDGVCGKQRLFVTAEFDRFMDQKDRMFRGAKFDFEATAKARVKEEKGPTAFAALLRTTDREDLTAKEACDMTGTSLSNISKTLLLDDVAKAYDARGWLYVRGRGRAPSKLLRGSALDAYLVVQGERDRVNELACANLGDF
jgi:hypothetical protein